MKTFEQLELQLWKCLQTAQDKPELAKVGALWCQMEEAIRGHEIKAQVEISAEAILQMARVVERRTQVLDEAVALRSGADPVMAADAFDRFVRQSMEVDFDQFVEAIGRKEHDYPESRELFSRVEEIDKNELLESLEPESQLEPMPELELEHDEDVGDWAAIIREWMVSVGVESVRISEVVNGTGLSSVKVLLSALPSDFAFKLKQENEQDFYSYGGLVLHTKSTAQSKAA